jgi:hypothetical protein
VVTGGETVTTTYLGRVALDELDHAQAVVDHHLLTCMVCGTNQPCRERREAEAVFLRMGRLPRRRPGLAGGESSQTPAAFVWFNLPTPAADER